MQADFSVECGPGDPTLEIPWISPDGTQRYFDLKLRPELLLNVEETYNNRELADFLVALNAAQSPYQTAKCDTWTTEQLDAEDAIFGVPVKYGSYVDIIFSSAASQLDFAAHESLASELSAMLARIPDFASAVEFVVRRCYYHRTADMNESEDGFYITLYLSGYGDDEDTAHKNWTIGLAVVRNAMLQVGAKLRQR